MTELPTRDQLPDTPFPLEPSIILMGRRGSEAHGTFIPSTNPDSIDDRDLMGIVVPPAPWTIGLKKWEGADSFKGPWDVVLYDFRKFVRLLLNQNPNVLSLLWTLPEDQLIVEPEGRALIDARLLFRARDKAFDAFHGYAIGQRKGMTKGEFAGYMGAKRKALVEKFGFDCKAAAHCVRILHMGEEYQREGVMHVRRTSDVAQILEIKRGEWSIERVGAHIDECLERIRDAHKNSVLPESIDEDAVERLVIQIVRQRGLSCARTCIYCGEPAESPMLPLCMEHER